ncbi:hypothetical protein [Acidovorax sp. NCPPB 4044]|uniref:hypothetical protein n=1 Tax=Acidovorax sp. NCPPB 4044 TaxID=2940490 RepID=UPI0023020F77|nr:hypothetical protein [Acidovorax sp. NCPPB 4044]MDA8521748.1 hypothetical protein [Acidovorax sp. NCPPB 4044]
MTVCASCGHRLAGPQAVCPECDRLLAPPVPDPTRGVFLCPGCAARFDAAGQSPWPENARWFVPQGVRLRCPHCRAVLRDRMRSRVSPWELGGLYVLLLLAQFQLPAAQARAATFGGMVVALLWVIWRRERGVPRENRYALEPARQPGTGATD